MANIIDPIRNTTKILKIVSHRIFSVFLGPLIKNKIAMKENNVDVIKSCFKKADPSNAKRRVKKTILNLLSTINPF